MIINKCEKCGCEKDWDGSDIECPFQYSENFADNWSCGMIGKIRAICNYAREGVDKKLHYQYCDEQHYVTINVSDLIEDQLTLWITWYKDRGRTEQMWLLGEYGIPRVPTFDELKVISEAYNSIIDEQLK